MSLFDLAITFEGPLAANGLVAVGGYLILAGKPRPVPVVRYCPPAQVEHSEQLEDGTQWDGVDTIANLRDMAAWIREKRDLEREAYTSDLMSGDA